MINIKKISSKLDRKRIWYDILLESSCREEAEMKVMLHGGRHLCYFGRDTVRYILQKLLICGTYDIADGENRSKIIEDIILNSSIIDGWLGMIVSDKMYRHMHNFFEEEQHFERKEQRNNPTWRASIWNLFIRIVDAANKKLVIMRNIKEVHITNHQTKTVI